MVLRKQGADHGFLYSPNNSPDSGSCIRRGRPDFPGAARRPKATVTCAAPPDGLPRPPPARRKADAILTAHRLRPARSPGSSTSGIPPDAPPCPRAPGSIRYGAGRQAGRFLLASGKSGNVLPTAYTTAIRAVHVLNVALAQGFHQGVRRFRPFCGNQQMDMIGHQHVGMNAATGLVCVFA